MSWLKLLLLFLILNMTLMTKTFLDVFTDVSEFGCYIGCIISLVIAKNLLRMGRNKKLTFVNQMLIIFYVLDALSGMTEVYFLFKLKRER